MGYAEAGTGFGKVLASSIAVATRDVIFAVGEKATIGEADTGTTAVPDELTGCVLLTVADVGLAWVWTVWDDGARVCRAETSRVGEVRMVRTSLDGAGEMGLTDGGVGESRTKAVPVCAAVVRA